MSAQSATPKHGMKSLVRFLIVGFAATIAFIAIMAPRAQAATKVVDPDVCVGIKLSFKNGELASFGRDVAYVQVINYCEEPLSGYISLPADTTDFKMYGRSNRHLIAPLGPNPTKMPRMWYLKVDGNQSQTLAYPLLLSWQGQSKVFRIDWNNLKGYSTMHIERWWPIGKK